jgi:hypothetical protein
MSDTPRGPAAERARVLQEHLVRTAYALHFTAADLAAQHERRSGFRMLPSGVDHRQQAKRWLVLSDHALDIVRQWDPGAGELSESDHPSVSDPARNRSKGNGRNGRNSSNSSNSNGSSGRSVPRQTSPDNIEQQAGAVLDRLFRVDAALQGVLPDVDAVVKAELKEAVRDLAAAMRAVRGIVEGVHALGQVEPEPPRVT